jgi:hypothetical protein
MQTKELGTTTQYDGPTWTGAGFLEQGPQRLWASMPTSLRSIAIQEIQHGNAPIGILDNHERHVVILILKTGPVIERQTDAVVRVHTAHQFGNYCYDGTKATYEDIETGFFLAFDDPTHIGD